MSHAVAGWVTMWVWLAGTVSCFALVIWPQPKLKPVNTRFRATVSNIIWCALVLTVFVVADHRGSFSEAAAYGQTVAVFWALPCFIFLGIVTGTSKWMRRD